MGEHRTSGGTRGISRGPVVTAGIIVVVVLVVIGWFQLRDRIADQGVQAADTCVEGAVDVSVTADADVASQVTELAQKYTATAPVVRDHCVSVSVATADSAAVATGLARVPEWDSAALGPAPALWIPSSSYSVMRAPASVVDGTPRSVASTPIVIASPADVTSALSAAASTWSDLADLQASPDGLDGLGLSGWGGLRLQLPTAGSDDATRAVLAAVAGEVSGVAPDLLTAEQVRGTPAVSALSALARTDRGTPAAVADDPDTVLGRVKNDAGAAADVRSVPVTEQQLLASGSSAVTGYSPSGTTPVADHPAAILAGPWMDETLSRAAAQFVEFMRQPANAQVFVDAGFDEGEPTTRPAPTDEVQRALLDVVGNPPTPRRVTTLLDVSGSMDTLEGARSRLQNTTAALEQEFVGLAGISDVGLWVYSKDLDGTRAFRAAVPTGPIDEQLPAGNRRQELRDALVALTPQSATSTYASVTATFVDAQENFVPGKTNSIVLITDGPNDDTTVTSGQFLSMLNEMVDPARPVSIEVVSIGTNSDAATLQSMADATGGTFTTVSTSEGPELPDLLRKLLY